MCSVVFPPKQEHRAVGTMAISVIYLTVFLVCVQIGLAAICCAGVWLLLLVWTFVLTG